MTRSEVLDLAAVRTLAMAVRLRHCEPGGDSQAHKVAYLAGFMADELEASRRITPALAEVAAERQRQDTKWGEQNHPDGTGDPSRVIEAKWARRECERKFAANAGTWLDVLEEEVTEAFAESDSAKLRAELLQVAAVAVAWVQAIDRRSANDQAGDSNG